MAQLTINTTPAEDARIVVAFGAMLGLGRNATAQEVKDAIANWVKSVVTQQERIAASVPAPIEPT